MKKYFLTLIFIFYSIAAIAQTNPEDAIKTATQKWASALASNQPDKIAALYDKNAYIYATFKNRVETPTGHLNYFKKLMQHPELKVDFKTQNIRVFDQIATSSGFYNFSYKDKNKTVIVPARYTFVYVLEPTGWMITEHHSSVLPE